VNYHLAQLNIALAVEALTSARLAGFVAELGPINALADTAPGFIWRLQTEDGDATAIRAFGDDLMIVNMSVWVSIEALSAFVFTTAHAGVLRRRREWFAQLGEAYAVAWWIRAGTVPTLRDAEARLAALRSDGPSDYAFTLRQPSPAPLSAP
jgi:Domain of unknown function (DUF3291)